MDIIREHSALPWGSYRLKKLTDLKCLECETNNAGMDKLEYDYIYTCCI